MTHDRDIAIIGLSVRVAGCDDHRSFTDSILEGRIPDRQLKGQRLEDVLALAPDFQYAPMPYLDRIDLFDAAFFNITPGEAKRMTPEQRIFLEEAVKCFFSATKSLDDIRGSKTGIFSSLANSQYGLLNTSNSNSSMAELDAAMNVTRLAHLFDLRGPAITVETTCSSALVALHQACQSLRDGTCEMALVGGINIALCSKENVLSSPVTSNDFDCRAFDAAANGTISGEGIVLALLQPLSEAIRESNPVFGIVKGSAINHGGARISNITAPSPEAQAEVLQQAWKNADVEGADLAWIEAHGTGTLLGDPIEIQGMVKALAKEGQSKTACAVGAVKSQFGHLNGAAGMLGLAKVVLSGQHDMIPPMTRFEQVNPAIDAADTGLYFPTSKAPWPSDRPYAGVSSFGLSGTNAHVVLKKYKEEWGAAIPDFLYVLQLCAVNEKVGNRIRQYLCDLIKADPNPSRVQSIVRAFNKIALQSENSQLYVADSVDDLLEALQATSSLSTTVKEDHQLYAFLSSDSFIEPLVFEKLGSIFPPIFANYHQLATSVDYPLGEEEQNVLRLLAYHQWLVSLGASFDKLIVNGRAQHLSDFLNGNINLSQALQAWTGASEPHLLKKKAFQAFVDSIAQSSTTAVIHLGMGCLGQLLTPALSSRCQLVGTTVESALESMTFLHHWSGPLRTAHLYGSKGKRHSLVIDPFQRERHWPEVAKRAVEPLVETLASTPETVETPAFQSAAEVQKLVRDIWTDCLQLDDPISLDADFFEIGGSSLMGLDVLDDIKKYTNIDLDYEDIFDHPTISALSKHLLSFLKKEEAAEEEFQPSKLLPIEKKDYQQLLEKTQQADVKSVVPRVALVTGATGYLGMHLLMELLEHGAETIHCIVRSKNGQSGLERLQELCSTYFPAAQPDWHRVQIWDLDLLADALPEVNDVDAIYHCAAAVNHFGRYERSEQINVFATQKLADWAVDRTINAFHHMSTLDVCGNIAGETGVLPFRETDLYIGQEFSGSIYPETKFRAEQLLWQYTDRLDVRIYRIGNISGHSQSGIFQKNVSQNASYLFIKSLMSFGCCSPAIEEMPTYMNPVDYVSRAIFLLSTMTDVSWPIFHITQPEVVRMGEVVEALEHMGIPLEKMSDEEALRKYEQLLDGESGRDFMIHRITSHSRVKEYTSFDFETAYTTTQLSKLNFDWNLDRQEFLSRIINYQIESGFFVVPDLKVLNR